jgi:hypothetical protein
MPLHVIIPTSHGDHQRLPLLAKQIKAFGPYRGHHLTVAPTQDVPLQVAEEFKATLDGLFDSIDIQAVKTSRNSWPIGPNQQFREVARLAEAKRMFWFFMEPDCALLRKTWLEELDTAMSDAERLGKRFLGAVVPTRGFEKGSDGTLIPVNGPPHMVGFGIYHPDLAKWSVKMPYLDRQFVFSTTPVEPFDTSMRDEIVPHAQHTFLIQHNFRTVNYRKDGDKIICDNAPGNPETASHVKPIDPRACILHGVKDDSLANLIMGGADTSKSPVPKTEEKPKTEAPKEPAPKGDKPSYLVFKAKEILKEGTAYRVKQMADKLEITEEVLRAEIDKPNSGLEIVNPGWIRVKSVSQ